MSFADAIRTCFAKYADFSGRASRPEFWWWALFSLLASMVLGAISQWLSVLFFLATLVPYLAVTARRLHDTGRSGWMQLIGLIPLIGLIIMIVWLAQPGKDSSRYAS